MWDWSKTPKREEGPGVHRVFVAVGMTSECSLGFRVRISQ